MKSEYEKCMAGEIYDCHDPIFISRKAKATEWMQRYNALPYAVVAAGAVVTDDVEAQTLVGGVPAKVIKRV